MPGRIARKRSNGSPSVLAIAQSPVSTSMSTYSPEWPALTSDRMSRS